MNFVTIPADEIRSTSRARRTQQPANFSHMTAIMLDLAPYGKESSCYRFDFSVEYNILHVPSSIMM